MPHAKPRRVRRAFTLIELISVLVVVAIIGGSLASLTGNAARALASANGSQRSAADASIALARIGAMLRHAPAGDEAGAALAWLEADGFELADGRGVAVSGGAIVMTEGGTSGTLLEDATLALTYLDDAGLEISPASADAASRVRRVVVVIADARGSHWLIVAPRAGFAWRTAALNQPETVMRNGTAA